MPTNAISLNEVEVTGGGLRGRLLGSAQSSAPSRVILDRVSLAVAPGEALALLGESGGGKSTLVRLLNRLVDADSGVVSVFGRDVSTWDIRTLRRTVLYLPQQPALFGGFVRDELLTPLVWVRRRPADSDLVAALALAGLEDLGLEGVGAELSDGQRSRLGLARAFLLAPEILVLDEPTAALDVRTARQLLVTLRQWAKENGTTLVVVTHRPEDASQLGGRTAFLLDRRLFGPYIAQDLSRHQVAPEVAAFLGSEPSQLGAPA